MISVTAPNQNPVSKPPPNTKGVAKRKARKPTAPVEPIGLDGVKALGRADGGKVWNKLVDEHSRPLHIARDWQWREDRALATLEKAMKRLGREATDRDRAAYLTSWFHSFEWQVEHATQETGEPRPAVASYNEPSTPPEMTRVLRAFLLEEFDASPMNGDLINGADFEVGIGVHYAEMTIAVVSQGVWNKVYPLINAAIKADLKS